MDKIYLYSSMTYCCASEDSNDHPDVFKAKFVVSDFSVNRNQVKLNPDTFPNWMNTLIGKPLVGKLATPIIGEADFTGHNMKEILVVDKDGNKVKTYEFDTQAFGVFTNIQIESIDNKEYIVADCDIWKRFPKACSIIQNRIKEGTLNTSWEIDIVTSHKEAINGNLVKIIDDGIFIGHCLLGKNTVPAYDCSRLLEVAEANEQIVDEELSSAFSQDVISLNNKGSLKKEGISLHLTDDENTMKSVVNSEDNNNSENTHTENLTSESKSEGKNSEEVNNENPEDSACGDGKKKEKSECDGDDVLDDKETSTDSSDNESNDSQLAESESSASNVKMTSYDLTKSLYNELERRRIYSCIEFHFPLDKTIWVKDDNRESSQLDYLVFTYEVDQSGTITLSDPQPARLSVEFKEMNSKFNEMVNAIASATEELSKKDQEIASLLPFKKRVEEEDAKKAAIERAEKVQTLRQYAINSTFISEAEVSEGGQLAQFVEELNEDKIKTIIAERYMSQRTNMQSEKNVETSSTTNQANDVQVVKHDLTGFQDENADKNNYKTVMRSYLGR